MEADIATVINMILWGGDNNYKKRQRLYELIKTAEQRGRKQGLRDAANIAHEYGMPYNTIEKQAIEARVAYEIERQILAEVANS